MTTPDSVTTYPAGQSSSYYAERAQQHAAVVASKLRDAMKVRGGLFSAVLAAGARQHARISARAGFQALAAKASR